MKPIRVRLYGTDPAWATSFYRSLGPWSRLERDYDDVEIQTDDRPHHWGTMRECDVLYLQSPHREQAVHSLHIARLSGIPTWVDYDDNCFAVPEDNPSFELYSQASTQAAIKECIRLASVVTVTNDYLREKFLPLNPNVRIVRNALDLKLLNFRPDPLPPRTKTLVWRGNSGHQRDLNEVADALVEVSHTAAFDGWNMLFMGHAPWHVIDRMRPGTAHYVPLMDIMRFFHFLMRERPAAILTPLQDTPFNRGRSNISYLEASYVGAVNVCRDLPEFERPGAAAYGCADEFVQRLRSIIECYSSLGEPDLAWWHVRENETLALRNAERYSILRELIG